VRTIAAVFAMATIAFKIDPPAGVVLMLLAAIVAENEARR
jgi:hypothetical protein